MSASESVVLILGIAAIAWIQWYFFFAGKPPASRSPTSHAAQKNHEQ